MSSPVKFQLVSDLTLNPNHVSSPGVKFQSGHETHSDQILPSFEYLYSIAIFFALLPNATTFVNLSKSLIGVSSSMMTLD